MIITKRVFAAFILIFFTQSVFAGTFSAVKNRDPSKITLSWTGWGGDASRLKEIKPGSTTETTVYDLYDTNATVMLTRTPTGLYTFILYRCVMETVSWGYGGGYRPVCTQVASRIVNYSPVPTVSVSAQSTQINEGGSTIISWSSANATSCSSSHMSGVSSTSGSATYRATTILTTNKSATVTITCSGAGGSRSASANIMLIATNDAPVVGTVANQTINEDASTNTINFTVSDEETAASQLSVTAVSNNTALLSAAGIQLGGSGSNRTIKLTPTSNQFGAATITIRVSDGTLTATRTFTVTVNPINDSPNISSINNVSITQAQSSTSVAFTVSDAETAAGSLAVTATSSRTILVANSGLIVNGSGASRTLVINAIGEAIGTSTITLTVTDANGGTNTRTFTFTRTKVPAILNLNTTNTTTGNFTLSWNYGTAFVRVREIAPGSTQEKIVPEIGQEWDKSGSFAITRTVNGLYTYKLYDCNVTSGTSGPVTSCPLAATKTITVSISAPTISMVVARSQLGESESTTINWSSTNSTSCSSTQLVGVIAASGSTTYKASSIIVSDHLITISIICTGPGGTTTKSIDLTMLAPVYDVEDEPILEDTNVGYCSVE